MLRLLSVRNYKCLRKVDTTLSNFHILVGKNASGKSTFLDVMVFLKDLFNTDLYKAVEKRVSVFEDLLWFRQGNSFQIAVEVEIPESIKKKLQDKYFPYKYYYARYEIRVSRSESGLQIEEENFSIKTSLSKPDASDDIIIAKPRKKMKGWKKIITRTDPNKAFFKSETTEWQTTFRIPATKSGLVNLPEDEERFPTALWFREYISNNILPLFLNSKSMKAPCRPDLPYDLLSEGENLPIVIERLKNKKPERFRMWLDHVRELIEDIRDIHVVNRDIDNYKYIQVEFENGEKLPVWNLSDGTVRFFALTVLAYLGENKTYVIEEPENGIHPKAVDLVYQSLSSVYEGQVFITTHSPVLLSVANLEDLLIFKLKNGETVIETGESNPELRESSKNLNVYELFMTGILS